eukprot:1136213-Pelagomonas_calceolata.AAC.5
MMTENSRLCVLSVECKGEAQKIRCAHAMLLQNAHMAACPFLGPPATQHLVLAQKLQLNPACILLLLPGHYAGRL